MLVLMVCHGHGLNHCMQKQSSWSTGMVLISSPEPKAHG